MAPSTAVSTNVLQTENHKQDKEFAKAMHGGSSQKKGGFTAWMDKDHKAQQIAVDEYFKHWDNKTAEDETEEVRAVCGDGSELLRQLS